MTPSSGQAAFPVQPRRPVTAEAARPVDIPYRQNRAVLFNSDLFHETAPLNFREGYENRRINVTLLHGERGGRE